MLTNVTSTRVFTRRRSSPPFPTEFDFLAPRRHTVVITTFTSSKMNQPLMEQTESKTMTVAFVSLRRRDSLEPPQKPSAV